MWGRILDICEVFEGEESWKPAPNLDDIRRNVPARVIRFLAQAKNVGTP